MVRGRGVGLIGSGVDSVMHGNLVIDGGGVGVGDDGGDVTGHLRGVDGGGVIDRLYRTISRGGGAVAVHSSVLDGVVDGGSSFSFSFGMD